MLQLRPEAAKEIFLKRSSELLSTGHNQGEDNLFYLLNGGEFLDIFKPLLDLRLETRIDCKDPI